MMDEYQKWLKKFEPKKTTDDCYTPIAVYEAVADWVANEYNLDRRNFIRPFYPGGDYEHHLYHGIDVVVDNPPFSILSEIIDFFTSREIRFFLFAPTLTLFGAYRHERDVTCVCTSVQVIYENGARVNTSFVTNLDGSTIVRTAPSLYRAVKDAQKKEAPIFPKYKYPDSVISSALIDNLSRCGVEFSVDRTEAIFTRALDSQRLSGKSIFGAGFILSEDAEERLRQAREQAREQGQQEIVWELSPAEEYARSLLGKRKENEN